MDKSVKTVMFDGDLLYTLGSALVIICGHHKAHISWMETNSCLSFQQSRILLLTLKMHGLVSDCFVELGNATLTDDG